MLPVLLEFEQAAWAGISASPESDSGAWDRAQILYGL
jgi:hypothetical protein